MKLFPLFVQLWFKKLSVILTVVIILGVYIPIFAIEDSPIASCKSLLALMQPRLKDQLLWPIRFGKGLLNGSYDFDILVSASPRMRALARELDVNPNSRSIEGITVTLSKMSQVLNSRDYGPLEYLKEQLKTNSAALGYIEDIQKNAQNKGISIQWQDQETSSSQRHVGKVKVYLGAMFTGSPVTTVALATVHELAHAEFVSTPKSRETSLDSFLDLHLRPLLTDEIVAIRAEKVAFEKLRQLGVAVKMKGVTANTRKIWSFLGTATQTQLENAIGNLGYNANYTEALTRVWTFNIQLMDKEAIVASIMDKGTNFTAAHFVEILNQSQLFKELSVSVRAKYVQSMIQRISQTLEEKKIPELKTVIANPSFEIGAVNLIGKLPVPSEQ